MKSSSTVVELFRESVIFQGLLAVICLIGTFILLALHIEVPQYVWILNGTVVGFFFGARNLLTARHGAQEMQSLAQTLAVQNAEIVRIISAPRGTPLDVAIRGAYTPPVAADEKQVGWTG